MSQSTPTPDTTARTETAETVTVPREALQTMRMRAAGLSNALYNLANGNLTGVYRQQSLDLVKEWDAANNDFNAALASPQHPVGVREAVAAFLKDRDEAFIMSDEQTDAERLSSADAILERVATLSHPPAQDAPGAEAIAALARGYELMQRVIWNMAGTSGPDAAWYRQQAQAVTDRVDALWKVEAGSNPSRPGDCLTQADKFLAALDPSPPLPKADGEVVARLTRERDFWEDRENTALHRAKAAEDAIVSALRERDEARALEAHETAIREEACRRADASEVAREKAEQVAAGLREAIANIDAFDNEPGDRAMVILERKDGSTFEMIGTGNEPLRLSDLRQILAALRASTEEGKTATPSVTDEEAGQ